MTGLSAHVIFLFYSSFHGDTKTSFPRKSQFQLRALYLDFYMLDVLFVVPNAVLFF